MVVLVGGAAGGGGKEEQPKPNSENVNKSTSPQPQQLTKHIELSERQARPPSSSPPPPPPPLPPARKARSRQGSKEDQPENSPTKVLMIEKLSCTTA